MDDDYTGFAAARWRPLLRAAIVLGCSPTEAEDLVQTTLLRCYVAWPKVVRAESRDAYAGRVLLNAFRESRRRRWWGERPAADLPEQVLDDDTGRVDDADAARRALAGLTAAQREVVVLRHYVGLSERETADLLGVPRGTVKSRLSTALGRLAGALDETEVDR
ncbi:SigE family RNA polymerase sigma factor [Nocardioides marinquilinus]|uniref:SigE family RNA polymerase sigma factor n=1 Tax=Nocardioides marinquilinus TaxID=1210400 RepID=A0ABP9P5K4_9ACTN